MERKVFKGGWKGRCLMEDGKKGAFTESDVLSRDGMVMKRGQISTFYWGLSSMKIF